MKSLRKSGAITAVYFPLRLFGPGPRTGLGQRQLDLMQVIVQHLTRKRGGSKSERRDRAETWLGSGASAASGDRCPFLKPGVHDVAFNGNRSGKGRRGHGYSLRTLMKKCRSYNPDDYPTVPQISAFLRDFIEVAKEFGLVVGAYHPLAGSWSPLLELPSLTRKMSDRAWLNRCLIKIYTADDYLVRWRKYFADKLGFALIPDRRQEPAVEDQDPTTSARACIAYLHAPVSPEPYLQDSSVWANRS